MENTSIFGLSSESGLQADSAIPWERVIERLRSVADDLTPLRSGLIDRYGGRPECRRSCSTPRFVNGRRSVCNEGDVRTFGLDIRRVFRPARP
jgi:hypothetical protein